MTIRIESGARAYLIASIKRFFAEEMDEDIGDLKADRVLGFFAEEIGPSVYNQAIAVAQGYFLEKTSDLANVRFEPEFEFWVKR
jgi:uncharacterized protein (DUF2164 family)